VKKEATGYLVLDSLRPWFAQGLQKAWMVRIDDSTDVEGKVDLAAGLRGSHVEKFLTWLECWQMRNIERDIGYGNAKATYFSDEMEQLSQLDFFILE